VKWLQYTGEVGKCTSSWCQIFSGFNTHKIIKIVYLVTELFGKYKGGRFWHLTVYRDLECTKRQGIPAPSYRLRNFPKAAAVWLVVTVSAAQVWISALVC